MSAQGQVLFIPHGGGPLPLLGEPRHQEMVEFLTRMQGELKRPEAIVIVSAHWEESAVTITSGAQPELIYDYYGFPPQSYEITYPAPGEPALAQSIHDLLQAAGINSRLDPERGFDHGVFIPLKLLYPDADIPCVQVSLLKSLDPAEHIRVGEALGALMQRNILVLGSGYSFHNLQVLLRNRSDDIDAQNEAFENWLAAVCSGDDLTFAQRREALIRWADAPHARYCHPREEHLLPLHVCAGIKKSRAEQVFNGRILSKRTSAFLW